jgi:outer membrane protein
MRTSILSFLSFVLFFAANAQEKIWTLEECVEYAVENNISIQQSELTNEALKEDIRSAEGNFYPNFNISMNQGWNFGSFIGQNGVRIARDSRTNNFNASTGVTLYNGGRNRLTLLQAKQNLEAAGFDLEESKNNIMLFVVNSYLNVLLNKESVIIAKDQVEISKKQVEITQELVDAGSSPKADLLDAQATLASNEEQLTSAQNQVDLALLSLAQLLQLSHIGFDVETVQLTVNSSSLEYNNTDDIFNTAVDILPEIKSAELAVENSELSVRMAKASNIPTLSVGGGFGSSYQHSQGKDDVRIIIDPDTGVPTEIDNGFGQQMKDNFGSNFAFRLNIPVFNNFNNKTNISRQKINQERAELDLIDHRIRLREAIEQAYADAKASLNQFISAEKSLEAQEESFKNAQVSYSSGVMTSFDFDQIRNRLVNAQVNMVNAKYNFVFRTKLLNFYLGLPIILD